MLIQCDFDGTIIRNNMSVLIREEFLHGNWQEIEKDYLAGRITVEQSNTLQFRSIRESESRLREFVRGHIDVRPGFSEFIEYCAQNGITFVIVSSGLDFYIQTVLTEIGMADLELYCAQTSFTSEGISVSYTDPYGNTVDSDFKCSYLNWLRQRDSTILYLGDGLSDVRAACQADYVFAVSTLQKQLDAESVKYSAFTDFFDVMQQVRRIF